MTDETPQFDDPSLKAAIRQLRGGERARPELRQRVEDLMVELRTSESSGDAQPAPIATAGQPRRDRRSSLRLWRPVAAAAAVLVAVGGVTGYRYYRHVQEEREEYARNDALIDAMIAAHEVGRGEAPGHVPLTASPRDPVALTLEATTRLGRVIPRVDLSPAGWTLDAASFCSVAGAPSARFHFARGGQGVSVLSLPASAWIGGREGAQYQFDADGHPIAGYIKSGSLTCVVGDASVSSHEVAAFRDRIRGG